MDVIKIFFDSTISVMLQIYRFVTVVECEKDPRVTRPRALPDSPSVLFRPGINVVNREFWTKWVEQNPDRMGLPLVEYMG